MKNTITLLLILFAFTQAEAQFIKKKSIKASIGFGASSPYDDVDVVDTGFYLQGEFVLDITSWFDVRPYMGLILTKSDGEDNDDNPTEYKATSRAFLIGGKARVRAPIPWVAPYIELGYGASIGSFRTLTPDTDIDKSGVIGHIPLSLGLELGPKHNVDLAFTYYFQPGVRQFAGALAVGLTIPLNN